jgi:hypothetical protein
MDTPLGFTTDIDPACVAILGFADAACGTFGG